MDLCYQYDVDKVYCFLARILAVCWSWSSIDMQIELVLKEDVISNISDLSVTKRVHGFLLKRWEQSGI